MRRRLESGTLALALPVSSTFIIFRPFSQLTYGYVLYFSSGLISEGRARRVIPFHFRWVLNVNRVSGEDDGECLGESQDTCSSACDVSHVRIETRKRTGDTEPVPRSIRKTPFPLCMYFIRSVEFSRARQVRPAPPRASAALSVHFKIPPRCKLALNFERGWRGDRVVHGALDDLWPTTRRIRASPVGSDRCRRTRASWARASCPCSAPFRDAASGTPQPTVSLLERSVCGLF